tara:strand:+ start:618 stop:827 length:210 start_codon:yes stop_codon:yes gene_type:complete
LIGETSEEAPQFNYKHRRVPKWAKIPEIERGRGPKNADVGFVLERSFCFELDRLVGWLPEVVLPNHDQN